MLTTRQLGEAFGVQRSTIGRWRARGLVQARICNEHGEWLYWSPKEIPPRRKSRTKTPATGPVGNSTV